jgi:hypothetical protein
VAPRKEIAAAKAPSENPAQPQRGPAHQWEEPRRFPAPFGGSQNPDGRNQRSGGRALAGRACPVPARPVRLPARGPTAVIRRASWPLPELQGVPS